MYLWQMSYLSNWRDVCSVLGVLKIACCDRSADGQLQPARLIQSTGCRRDWSLFGSQFRKMARFRLLAIDWREWILLVEVFTVLHHATDGYSTCNLVEETVVKTFFLLLVSIFLPQSSCRSTEDVLIEKFFLLLGILYYLPFALNLLFCCIFMCIII